MRRYQEYEQSNRNKQLLSSMTSPLTLVGLTFIFNFVSSIADFLYLDSFASIFFILMLASALALLTWTYCSFTGKFRHVVVEIDGVTRIIFEHARSTATQLLIGAATASATGAGKETKKTK